MPNGTALELVLRVPLRIPGTEVSFVAGNTGGEKGKELFPRLVDRNQNGNRSLCFFPFPSSSVEHDARECP